MDNPSSQPGGTGEEDSVPGTDGEVSVVIGNPEKVYKIPANFKDNLNKTDDDVFVWDNGNNASQSDALGRDYSVVLGISPKNDGYATVGEADPKNITGSISEPGTGSFRIPAIVKTQVRGKLRLIAAFDVRYRGGHNGNGDAGDSNAAGADITVMYSDDGGATWTPAKNKSTGTIPAIDVDNDYNSSGVQDTSASATHTLDVGDPQLTVAPDGTVWCGMAAGNGTIGTRGGAYNFRMWKSGDNGETWEEAPGSGVNPATNTWYTGWSAENNLRTLLTTPGHGIVLGKDVPGAENFKKGQTVMPLFQKTTNDQARLYLATGTGSPDTWSSSTFSPIYNRNGGVEEGQVCQLDDGSLLMHMKTYNVDNPSGGSGTYTTFAQLKDGRWTAVHDSDVNLRHGKASQASILKVADGDGSKAGVVAFVYSGNQPANRTNKSWGSSGRGNITVALARDVSAIGGQAGPLDPDEVYFLKLRTPGQGYFAYADLVMIDENTLGILYENYSGSTDTNRGRDAKDGTNGVQGMRFCRVDISEIIKVLQTVN